MTATKTKPAVETRALEDIHGCDLCCFWLAPDGKASFLGLADRGSHCGVATALGDETGGRELDKQGYVHVSGGGPFMGDPDGKPTQAQLDTLFDVQQELIRQERHGPARGIERYLQKQAAEETA